MLSPRSKQPAGDNEWYALYDRQGYSLPADPRTMMPADQRRIKQLGLWQHFMSDNLDKNGGFTYFYKQGDPNGHVR